MLASLLGEMNGDHSEFFSMRKQQSHYNLIIGNWNIFLPMGKEHKLLEEAKQYSLDVVGIFATKSCGSTTVELSNG